MKLTNNVDALGLGRFLETFPIGSKFSDVLNTILDDVSELLSPFLLPPTFIVKAPTGAAGATTQQTAGVGGFVFTKWAQPDINRGFSTAIPWNTATPGALYIAKPGTYRVSAFFNIGQTAGQTIISINGAAVIIDTGDHGSAAIDMRLNANDYIQLTGFSATAPGAVPQNVGRAMLSVVWVGK